MRYLLLLFFAATTVHAQSFKEKAPGPKSKGRPYAWKTRAGFEYVYLIPKSYKPKKPATLLIIFHDKDQKAPAAIGSYPRGFRPDDILLYPGRPQKLKDGSYAGSVEFTPKIADARVIRGVFQTLTKPLKVRATYVYGIGKGGSFALFYAGLNPEIEGVVAETDTVWKDTEITKAHEHKPMLLMQFLGNDRLGLASYAKGLEFLRQKGIKQVRHSVTFGASGDPTAVNGGLAWCEAMSTGNSDRLKGIYRSVSRIRNRATYDYAGLYQIAKKMKNERTAQKVEKLAAAHAAAIVAALGDNKEMKFDGKPWLGHYFAFRRGFAGVPACDKLIADWKATVDKHAAIAKDQLPTWTDQRTENPQAAFWACAEIIRRGCLDSSPLGSPMATDLAKWRAESDKHVLDKSDLASYDAYVIACEQGAATYDEANKGWRP